MSRRPRSSRPLALLALALAACQEIPPEVTDSGSGSTTEPGTTGTTTVVAGSSSTTASDETGIGSGSATGTGTDTGLETSSSSGGEPDESSSSGDATTGGVSDVGCADGEREDLVDELTYPDIAACSGGFGVPGVGNSMPTCGRQGGDDGPMPDGQTCTIDDLCAEGWHVCESQGEVAGRGIGDCGALSWTNGFYATAQSGEGANTCNPTGTNDVFGCGDVGYTNINGCAPLNRSTGNLCVELMGPWSCPDAIDELGTLVKTGADYGGALCCRDDA